MTIIFQFAEKDIGLQFLHSISATSTRLQLAESAFQVIQTAQSNCLNLIVAMRWFDPHSFVLKN